MNAKAEIENRESGNGVRWLSAAEFRALIAEARFPVELEGLVQRRGELRCSPQELSSVYNAWLNRWEDVHARQGILLAANFLDNEEWNRAARKSGRTLTTDSHG